MPVINEGQLQAANLKGADHPADPPTVDEIVAVMRQARQARYGARPNPNRLIVVLWRAELRIHEALSLIESDLDPRRRSILIKHGKGDRRRELGIDASAWSAILSSSAGAHRALPPHYGGRVRTASPVQRTQILQAACSRQPQWRPLTPGGRAPQQRAMTRVDERSRGDSGHHVLDAALTGRCGPRISASSRKALGFV